MKMLPLLTCWTLSGLTIAIGKEAQPNIVFILSDDHTYRDIGAYGNQDVHTPNLDRLAAEGMRFDRAYAAAALCTPTRLAIASGLWPHGYSPNAKKRANHLVDQLKAKGYYTTSVAKTIPGDFDLKIKCCKTTAAPAVEFLESYNQKRPLFLVFGAEGTHLEWPQNEAKRYDPSDFTIAPNLLDTPETRKRLQKYYSSVTCVDNQVGEILNALKKKEWEKNTIVIYSSDQGASFPFAKWCLYEDGIRVPFIVRAPGISQPGSSNSAMISQVDFAATLLELAGMSREEAQKGSTSESFVPVLRGEKVAHREIVFASHRGDHGRGNDPKKDAMPRRHHNRNPALAAVTFEHKVIVNLRPKVPFGIRLNGYCNNDPKLRPKRPVIDFWREWEGREKADAESAAVVQHFLFRDPTEFYDLKSHPWEQVNLWDKANPIATELLKRMELWRSEAEIKMPDYGEKKMMETRR